MVRTGAVVLAVHATLLACGPGAATGPSSPSGHAPTPPPVAADGPGDPTGAVVATAGNRAPHA